MQIEGVGIVSNVIIMCCRIWVWDAALFLLWIYNVFGRRTAKSQHMELLEKRLV